MPLGNVVYESGPTLSHVYFPTTAIVSLHFAQLPDWGRSFRLKTPLLVDECDQGGPVLRLLLRYTQALLTQMAQTAVCNRHHSLHQQLCRWLLLSLDRLQGNELVMKQELIANMLGVSREGVTEAASRLQSAGLIRYSRGRILVLNRAELEKRTCECY